MGSNGSANKRVFKNAFFLALLQLFNFLVPILLLPFLTRTLEIEEFGVVMVALSSTIFAYVITDYGFSLSATYYISRNRGDRSAIENAIGRIFTAKVLLVAVAIALLLGLSMLPAYHAYREIFWVSIPAVIAQAYQPIWLFHGMERMKHYTAYMVSTKLAYLGFVLLMVNEKGDGYLVLLGWSMAHVLGMLVSAYMMRQLGYGFKFGSIESAIEELKDSAKFFYSRLAVAGYTTASSIIIGLSSLHQAALYASSEQIYKAGQAVTNPVNQALYPYMAKEKNWKLFFLILPIVTVVLVLGVSIIYIYREFFITLIFGSDYLDAAPVLSIFLVTQIINYLGVSFGYPACSALSRTDIANTSVLYGTFIFFLTLALFYFYDGISAINMALSVLVTELFVAIYRIIKVKGLLSNA